MERIIVRRKYYHNNTKTLNQLIGSRSSARFAVVRLDDYAVSHHSLLHHHF